MDIKRASVKREFPGKMCLRNSGLNKVNQSPFCRHFIILNQDGDIGHFLLWSPSPEDQLTALQRQDSTRKISVPGGEAQRPRRISLEGEEECLHLERMEPSPRPAQSPTERGPMGLRFLQRKKRAQGGHPAPSYCRMHPRRPTRVSPHGARWGMCSLTTDGRGREAYSKQHPDGSGLRSSLQQPPIDIPAKGLPLCGAEPIAPPGQEAWSSALPSLNIKTMGSTSVDPILWPCLGREANS